MRRSGKETRLAYARAHAPWPCVPTNARSDIWPKLVGDDRPPARGIWRGSRPKTYVCALALLADGGCVSAHAAVAPVPIEVCSQATRSSPARTPATGPARMGSLASSTCLCLGGFLLSVGAPPTTLHELLRQVLWKNFPHHRESSRCSFTWASPATRSSRNMNSKTMQQRCSLSNSPRAERLSQKMQARMASRLQSQPQTRKKARARAKIPWT